MPFGTIAKLIKERKQKTAKNLEKPGFSRAHGKIAFEYAVFSSSPALPGRWIRATQAAEIIEEPTLAVRV